MERVLNNSYFAAETKVLTENGEININNIVVGDMVLTHENTYKQVLEIQNSKNDVYMLETMDGTKFAATGNQFFLVSQKKKGIYTIPQKKMLNKLNKDDYLLSHFETDGSGHIYHQFTGVKTIKLLNEKVPTYNLIVEDSHTFIAEDKIVFDNSVLVKA